MALHRDNRVTRLRRAGVPAAAVAGIAAIGVGVWPALASDGNPDLPDVSARELLVQVAGSDTARFSGTVRVNAELPGLPSGAGASGLLDGVLDGVLDDAGGSLGTLSGVLTGDSSLEVAVDGPERQRVAVSDGDEELVFIHNGDEVWTYDSARNTVLRGRAGDEASGASGADLTPQEAADRLLAAVGDDAEVTVDGTSRVAGREAYDLLVTPAGPEAEQVPLRSARIAVDAETGVPLALTAESREGGSFDVSFSRIDYAPPAGGVFDFTPPAGAEVIDLTAEDAEEALAELLPGLLGEMPGVAVPEELAERFGAELGELEASGELAELEERFGDRLPEGIAEALRDSGE